jgi:aminoglycoside phosphotransferase (APT) family kinase protein
VTAAKAVDLDLVAAAAGRHLGATEVVDLRRLSGGASRETWSFDAVVDGGAMPLILRRDPPGRPTPDVDEYALLTEAERAGVAVPPLRFRLDESDDLGHGFVMDRIDGETLGRHVVQDEALTRAREQFSAQCGNILAAIHAMDIAATPLRRPADPAATTLRQIEGFEQLLDSFEVARPVLELGLRWLRQHVPTTDELVVVHGDFRVGNLIVGPEGIRSVLDWELAHLGNPAEDIGWLCVRSWRFGGAGRVGGCGDLDDLLTAYAAAGGRPIDADEALYWEVFGTVRWGVICVMQAFTHLQGIHRSVELAAIGRRVCEVETDVMELLG